MVGFENNLEEVTREFYFKYLNSFIKKDFEKFRNLNANLIFPAFSYQKL
jgi:hypothetical protein